MLEVPGRGQRRWAVGREHWVVGEGKKMSGHKENGEEARARLPRTGREEKREGGREKGKEGAGDEGRW